FVLADPDRATPGCGGAPRRERAVSTQRAELGGPAATTGGPDRRLLPGRAADAARLQVDIEVVLAEQPTRRRRGRLDLAPVRDIAVLEPLLQVPSPVSGITVDLELIIIISGGGVRPAGTGSPARVKIIEVVAGR